MLSDNNSCRDNLKVISLLRGIARFDNFSDRDLKAFISLSRLTTYEPGSTIIREGDYDCWVYFLISGTIEIVKDNKVIATLQRNGDLFGEMGVIEGSSRSASIIAKTESIVLGVDASVIDRKLKTNEVYFCYTVYRLFAEVLAARLRNTTTENMQLRKELAALKGTKA